jgi:hypothetical protein
MSGRRSYSPTNGPRDRAPTSAPSTGTSFYRTSQPRHAHAVHHRCLMGPALMMCIGLLRVLEDLIDAKTNLEGVPSSEFHATDTATHAVGSQQNRPHR